MRTTLLLLLATGAIALVLFVALSLGSGPESGAPEPPEKDPIAEPDEPPAPPGVQGDPEISETAGPPEAKTGESVLVVEVVDGNGSPVSDAAVDLRVLRHKGAFRRERTDSEGRCSFADLPAGTRFAVTAKGPPPLTSASKTVKLDTSPMTVALVLEEGGGVTGTVLAESGGALGVEIEVEMVPSMAGRMNRVRAPAVSFSSAGDRRTVRLPAGEPRFEFAGLAPGKYSVQVRAEGYQPGQSEVFEVREGETTTGIEVSLSRGGRVSGIVVAGKTGAPVEGARVSLLPAGSFAFESFSGASARIRMAGQHSVKTDPQGRFRFDAVKPGDYGVIATAKDKSPARVNEVVVEKDRETGGIFLSLGEGGAITGTVYGPEGRPEAGAAVLISRIDPRIEIMGDFGNRVEADENGTYFLDHLEPGAYRVRRPQGGTSMAVSMRVSVSGSGNAGAVASRAKPAEGEVIVHEGQVTRHDLHSAQTSSVFVRVTDGDGKPLKKMVSLRTLAETGTRGTAGTREPPGPGPRLFIPVTGMTNEKGEHEFRGVKPGSYEVVVEGHREPVDVAPGGRESVEVRMVTSRVAGRVVDENGEAVEGATVLLQPVRVQGSGGFAFFSPTGRKTTDEDGRFEFPDVSPGRFRVQVMAEKRSAGAPEFDVAPGEKLEGIEIRLEALVSVRFGVVDASGRPVADALLMFVGTSSTQASWERPRTDSRGEAGTELLPGEYRVFVHSGQEPREAEPETITVGRSSGQTFTLRLK